MTEQRVRRHLDSTQLNSTHHINAVQPTTVWSAYTWNIYFLKHGFSKCIKHTSTATVGIIPRPYQDSVVSNCRRQRWPTSLLAFQSRNGPAFHSTKLLSSNHRSQETGDKSPRIWSRKDAANCPPQILSYKYKQKRSVAFKIRQNPLSAEAPPLPKSVDKYGTWRSFWVKERQWWLVFLDEIIKIAWLAGC